MNAVAYGSLYLDQGEGMPLVKKQVKSWIKHKEEIAMVGFDILCTAEQEERAQLYKDKILEYIRQELPGIDVSCTVNIVE
jgi:hypothetical protein